MKQLPFLPKLFLMVRLIGSKASFWNLNSLKRASLDVTPHLEVPVVGICQVAHFFKANNDALGQVTSGKKRWSDGTLVAGEQFEYTFDDIGNRKQSRYGGDANGSLLRRFNYGVNLLNQYTTRSAGPGTVRYANILGEATNAATVTVNNQAPYRRGDFFRLELPVTNTAPVWLGVTNIAVLNQGTNVDLIATNAGSVFVPKTPEAFGYDADGNMTNDGRFALTWDAENRLVKVESLASAPVGSKRKVEWTFDGLGRRVRQTEFVWNASTNDYQLSTDTKLVSDGWRNIAELNATNLTLRTYAWGLDLSGSLGGAGGVGGLLMINSASAINSQPSTHFYAYDGNGNVAALVSAATGTASANYEYEPFGVTLRATGPMALENPFRFSTKRASDATDWVLYEYRGYSPGMGRWLSRDPIGERGGVNIFAFVRNDSIHRYDGLGLYTLDEAEGSLRDSGVQPAIPATPGQALVGATAGAWVAGTPPQYSDQQIFNEWYRLEKARGAWWNSLPKCPKKLCIIMGALSLGQKPQLGGQDLSDSAFNVFSKDRSQWKSPKPPSNAELNLHPGTIWTMRSKPDASGHANQCTYDATGTLLETPPGSGTVDWYRPGLTTTHYNHDVAPAYMASRLDGGASMGVISSTFTGEPNIFSPPGSNLNKYYEVRPLWAEAQ